MPIEQFGGVRFNQVWDSHRATDIPPGKEPLLLCRNVEQPVLTLEGAPLRIDRGLGLDVGETPFLRHAASEIELRAPDGLSIQTGNHPVPVLAVSADGSVGIGSTAHGGRLEIYGEVMA